MTTHAGASSPNPYPAHPAARSSDGRRRRARRAAFRYLFVWSAVAALALIAQAVAPAATG